MRESGGVTEAETFRARPAQRGGEQQARRDPRETGKAEPRKRSRQQKSRADGGRETAERGGQIFQPAQLASKILKDKFCQAERKIAGAINGG